MSTRQHTPHDDQRDYDTDDGFEKAVPSRDPQSYRVPSPPRISASGVMNTIASP